MAGVGIQFNKAAADAKHQSQCQVHAAVFDNRGRITTLVQRVAGQTKSLHIAGLGLLGKIVADHPHAVENQRQLLLGQLALQRPHQTSKGGDGGKAMGERAGNGVGVLDAQTRQNQQAIVIRQSGAHVASRVAARVGI